ncbi:MAG: hypothetical protein M0R70_03125 [Nitrospirae bacterium]|nr:hypothetical protein [Nitrospirota bacterium]
MIINKEIRQNDVGEIVSALFAVTRPILHGILYSVKEEVAKQAGGYENIPLFMIPRIYRPGDGDVGICFEYAVHDAINRRDTYTIDKISDAVKKYCRVPGTDLSSILFGVEKEGKISLINTSKSLLTDQSRILTGGQNQPPLLKRHINMLAAAFRRPETRIYLPFSISGLWKADLFVGNKDSDRWVGTTVKVHKGALEGAKGLRLGIIGGEHGKSDKISFDESKNLVICPMPYDQSFMEVFYNAWIIIKQLIAADMRMPRSDFLSQSHEKYIAEKVVEKREMKIVDFIQYLDAISQPELLISETEIVDSTNVDGTGASSSVTVAPIARLPLT